MIRFGTFTAGWPHKPAMPGHVVLMPIPLPQMDANPMLDQTRAIEVLTRNALKSPLPAPGSQQDRGLASRVPRRQVS